MPSALRASNTKTKKGLLAGWLRVRIAYVIDSSLGLLVRQTLEVAVCSGERSFRAGVGLPILADWRDGDFMFWNARRPQLFTKLPAQGPAPSEIASQLRPAINNAQPAMPQLIAI